jgi:hypothetical protein
MFISAYRLYNLNELCRVVKHFVKSGPMDYVIRTLHYEAGTDSRRELEVKDIVEVVLRHFHRCRHWNSTAMVLLLEGLRSHKVLVIGEYDGHDGLHGSGRWSVTPYVHG